LAFRPFHWILRWRESADPHVGLDSLVARARPGAPAEDRLAWLRDVSAWVRSGLGESAEARATSPQAVRLRHLLGVLERQPQARAAFAETLRASLGRQDAFDLLIETGMPREAGFLGELANRLFAKVLPEPPPTELSALFVQVFPRREDAELVAGISPENWAGILALLGYGEGAEAFRAQLASAATRAVNSLALQACAATLPSVIRRRMQIDPGRALAAWSLPEAASEFVAACDAGEAPARAAKSEALRAVIGRSLIEVEAAYAHLDEQGVSIAIVYQLERIRAQLQRAGELADLLAAPEHLPAVLPHFIAGLVRDVHDHRSVLALLNQNFELAARKVVERSAETGEHYITRDRAEYRAMLRHAGGGGAVMAVTTYVKLALTSSHLTLFREGLLASLNYAASFVAIQLAGFTVATKQPAMTAPALAARMKGLDDPARLEAFVDEVAALVRSQAAGIFGNVFVVFPAAWMLGALLAGTLGANPVDAEKAGKIVDSFSILGPSALFAAFTGVLLWISSVLAGWVDNWFAYRRLGPAIASHRRLVYVFGPSAMQRAAGFLSREIAGFTANISLGFLLGSVPVVFAFHDLPVEVRHVTLSSGQLAAAVVTLGWGVVASAPFWLALAGIAVIGLLNVGVSFALALNVAIRARNIEGLRRRGVYRAILRRMLSRPASFLVPKGEGN
jgi:site-specific recombinase